MKNLICCWKASCLECQLKPQKRLNIFDSPLDVSCNRSKAVASENWAPCICDSERSSEEDGKHPGSVSCPWRAPEVRVFFKSQHTWTLVLQCVLYDSEQNKKVVLGELHLEWQTEISHTLWIFCVLLVLKKKNNPLIYAATILLKHFRLCGWQSSIYLSNKFRKYS